MLSQGSVVYNKALNRYLYTSWTEYTFEFYESPTPWGPWKKFLSKDYGGYPWSTARRCTCSPTPSWAGWRTTTSRCASWWWSPGSNGTRAIEKVAHFGNLAYLNNGYLNDNEDSWDQENKALDWWGYTWPRNYNLNKLSYTTGGMFTDGGWFSGNLWVQVRQNGQWVNVTNLRSSPYYPLTSAAGANKTYTFVFNDTWGDGIRILTS
ncbi:hypothetical protein [Archangium sp.]|uniref:hypothetical protein n=1 Tax=Archangium sp. TaxID=1872627 RepID=UPI002D4D545F|nr:hypothetical protein [Archangium sp.]HYO52058.1 hypothetical protein [Archangium sp.]